MIFFAGKSKQPVTCGKGWDMCLINTTDLKCTGNSFMTSLHCMCIFCVEWTSLLIDHNSILFQRIVTIPIEFASKQSFRWAKRIRGIHDNEIIFRLASSDKTECIFVMKMYSSVIQSACIFRKVCTTCLDNHRIHFYQINVPDPVVSG